MTRQQKLNQLMREGSDVYPNNDMSGFAGYDVPPYTPSQTPYIDDFSLGQLTFTDYLPWILIAGVFLMSRR